MQHLQKAFFQENPNWPSQIAICGRKPGDKKFVDMGIKRSVLQSLIQRSKRFV